MTTTRRWAALALVLAAGVGLGAQTGIPTPMPRAYFPNAAGTACGGCLVFTYAAGTTTKQSTYSDAALSVPNSNPLTLDANGTAPIFLNPTQSYKFVLAPSGDTDPPAAAIYTQDNITGPYSGVFSITAADTRGLRLVRSAADVGIALTSTGGSGKTYGIESRTDGALRIQDDSDSTPRVELSGNNITNTLTGTYTVSGGLFSVTGFGAHSIAAGGTGTQTLVVRNSTAGATNGSEVSIGNDVSSQAGRILQTSSTYTPSAPFLANSFNIFSTQSGGLSVGTTGSAATRLYTNSTLRGQVLTSGRLSWESGYATSSLTMPTGLEIGTQAATDRVQLLFGDGSGYSFSVGHSGSGSYVKDFNIDDRGYITAPRNPFFFAVNTTTDVAQLTGSTVGFDTELSDVGGNFASNQFTAPVAGVYEFCASVTYSDNSDLRFTAYINIGGVLHTIGSELGTTAGTMNGCVFASMGAGNGAQVSIATTDASVDIEGSASPRATWFAGRLVQ